MRIQVDVRVTPAQNPLDLREELTGRGVSVGGGNFGMRIADLVTGARLYALTARALQPGSVTTQRPARLDSPRRSR